LTAYPLGSRPSASIRTGHLLHLGLDRQQLFLGLATPGA